MTIQIQAPDGSIAQFPDGTPDDAITAAMAKEFGAPQSTAADVAKSFGVGVGKGAIGLAGFIGDAANLLNKGTDAAANYIGGKFGLDPIPETLPARNLSELVAPRENRNVIADMLGSQNIQKQVEKITGEFYKPQTRAGKIAETLGEFTPGMIGGGASIPMRFATRVAAPALGSEAAGYLTEGTAAEPYARMGGAIAGGLAPGIAARVVTPLPTTAERTAMVNTLRNEGVTDITAGQATGRRGLQYIESEMGGMRAPAMTENQGEQFTRAALRRVGENANRASAETIDRAFDRIGQQFDDLAARNSAVLDRQFGADAGRVVNDYYGLVQAPNRVPAVTNYATEIVNQARNNGGVLPGDVYQSLRSRMEATARGTGNPEARTAIRDLRAVLDDAMERSIQANNPGDLGAWQNTRREYRNMLVLEKAATGAGSQTAEGFISPSQLRNATVGQNRRAYARGDGDFADLARAGEAILKPLPQSGTAPRLRAQNLGASLMSMLGAGVGATHGPEGAMAGMMVGAGVPAALGRALMSRPGRAYLSNQVLADTINNMDTRRAAAIAALLSGHQQLLQAPSSSR